MGIETSFFGLIIAALDIYAIIKIIDNNEPTSNKVVWILLILVLPIIGFILWFLLKE